MQDEYNKSVQMSGENSTSNQMTAETLVQEARRCISLEEYGEAKEKLEQAAGLNDLTAMNLIGELYLNEKIKGREGEDNEELAMEWFKKAVAINSQCAAKENYLYVLYHNHFKYWEDAILYKVHRDKDYAIVSRELHKLYPWPDWVDDSVCGDIAEFHLENEDYEEYVYWAGKTYERTHNLDYLIKVSRNIKESDLGRRKRIFQEIRKRAEENESEAIELCGDCYRIGYGVPKSEPVAVYWYEKVNPELIEYVNNVKTYNSFKYNRQIDEYYKFVDFEDRQNYDYYPKTIMASNFVVTGEKVYKIFQNRVYTETLSTKQPNEIDITAQRLFYDGKNVFAMNELGNKTEIVVISEDNDQIIKRLQIEGKCTIVDSQETTLLCLQLANNGTIGLLTYDVDIEEKKEIVKFTEDLDISKGAFINDKYVYYNKKQSWIAHDRRSGKKVDVSEKLGLDPFQQISWIDGKNNYAWIRKEIALFNDDSLGTGGLYGEESEIYYEAYKIFGDSHNHLIWPVRKCRDGEEEHFMETEQCICNGKISIAVVGNTLQVSDIWGRKAMHYIDFLNSLEQVSINDNCIYVLDSDTMEMKRFEITANGKIVPLN